MKEKEHKTIPHFWRCTAIFVFLCLGNLVQAQTITQRGNIVDKNNEPIVGVTIMNKGGKGGTVSDLDGNFSLQVSKGSTLSFSFLGYKTVEQKATGGTMHITMFEDTKGLDEVVVVGYGTMSKKHISGAMTSIDGKKIEEK
ncbi:MAG: carboxypeptidase-like regulatory domain-containing protein, partial [Prevotella sp.]|nr:carboxypeptidase-like regulatory domain-containing protein [Prevotella sp.]